MFDLTPAQCLISDIHVVILQIVSLKQRGASVNNVNDTVFGTSDVIVGIKFIGFGHNAIFF